MSCADGGVVTVLRGCLGGALQSAALRGGRGPAGAHAVSVGPAGRLRCGAHDEVARWNSLRSLRSLRSNSHRESVHEARCACRPRRCAPRRAQNRPHRAPPAAQHRCRPAVAQAHPAHHTNAAHRHMPWPGVPMRQRGHAGAGGWAGRGEGASEAPSSAGRVARARSAPRHLTRRRVSERRWQSHRSELRGVGHSTEQRRAVRATRGPRKLSPRPCPPSPTPRHPTPHQPQASLAARNHAQQSSQASLSRQALRRQALRRTPT